MMEEGKNIWNYLGQIFTTYGIIIFIFIIYGTIFGEDARNSSSLFEYGAEGFSKTTLVQLFIQSFIITLSQIIILTDRVIKKMAFPVRILLFFVVVLVEMIFFILKYEWFSTSEVYAWIGFFASFSVCSIFGIVFSVINEKKENQKMAKALEKYQKN